MGTDIQIKGRITTKKLIEWINKQFEKFEISEYEVTEIHRTYFTQNDYECGACRMIIKFKRKKEISSFDSGGYFYCFYRIKELENYLANGYELWLKNNGTFGLLTDLELDVRKK